MVFVWCHYKKGKHLRAELVPFNSLGFCRENSIFWNNTHNMIHWVFMMTLLSVVSVMNNGWLSLLFLLFLFMPETMFVIVVYIIQAPVVRLWSISCNKTSPVALLICSILNGKICTSASARVLFCVSAKSNELTEQQHMLCFNHASAFYMNNNIVKMLINNKFKAQTLTANPSGNVRCHVLKSRALSVYCSFGQSARSIESRCVVIHWNWTKIHNSCSRYIY